MITHSLLFEYVCICPSLSWDRVNFVLSSWYSAVFCFKYENNIYNTLIFWVLLTAYSKSRAFQFPML